MYFFAKVPMPFDELFPSYLRLFLQLKVSKCMRNEVPLGLHQQLCTTRNQLDRYFRLSDVTTVLIFRLPGTVNTEQIIVVK